MNCLSCSTEINSAFTHAIKSNTCPACGKSIYSTDLEEQFSSLYEELLHLKTAEAITLHLIQNFSMERLEGKSRPDLKTKNNNTSEISDNVPQDDEEVYVAKAKSAPVKVNRSPPKKITLTSSSNEKIVSSPDRVAMFQKLSGAAKLPKGSSAKELVQDIQSNSDEEMSDEDYSDIDHSSLSPLPKNVDLSGIFEMDSDSTNNAMDPRALQQLELKRIREEEKREELASSGSIGMIRRSS